jgi:RNA polymerase sigma-70 factor, ECF subfamily
MTRAAYVLEEKILDSSAEDAMLVRRMRGGDRDAFGGLVRRHLKAAYAAAVAVSGDPVDAEDICQDAFVLALERIEQCHPEEKFRPWLLAIVRNRAIDVRRRRRVRAAEPLEAIEERQQGRSILWGQHEPGPLREAERADTRAHLTAAIATLTAVRREVLLLHDLEGWSHHDIAAHLGVAEGTVRSHLFWARRDVRARLSPEFRGGADDVR